MILRNLFLLSVLVLLSNACKDSVTNKLGAISIDVPLNNQGRTMNLSEIVDNLSYIRLETSPDCLIGNIDKLMIWDERFILADKDKAKAIFIFDNNGNFIRKLNKIGRGPGEFITLTDFTINEKGFIILYDGVQQKLIVFSQDGLLQKEYKLSFNADKIAYLGNNQIAFYCDFIPNKELIRKSQYPNLIFYDLNKEKIQNCGLDFNQNIFRQETIGYLNNFTQFNNLFVGLIIPMDNFIYKLSADGETKPFYYLNLGKEAENAQNMYKNQIINNVIDAVDADKEFTNANYPILLNYLVCDDVMFLYYRKGVEYYYGFYYPEQKIFKESCVKNRSLETFRLPIKNDLDDVSFFMPLSTDGKNIYYILEPYLLKNNQDHFVNAVLEDLNKKVTIEDNPLIVRSKLKSNLQ